VDQRVLLLPVLDLDEVLATRVSFLTCKRRPGGHDVPWQTPQGHFFA